MYMYDAPGSHALTHRRPCARGASTIRPTCFSGALTGRTSGTCFPRAVGANEVLDWLVVGSGQRRRGRAGSCNDRHATPPHCWSGWAPEESSQQHSSQYSRPRAFVERGRGCRNNRIARTVLRRRGGGRRNAYTGTAYAGTQAALSPRCQREALPRPNPSYGCLPAHTQVFDTRAGRVENQAR
jgi:hypothetical protein